MGLRGLCTGGLSLSNGLATVEIRLSDLGVDGGGHAH